MYMPASSRIALTVPVYGPPGTDLAQLAAGLAVIADDGTEPVDADWGTAAWDTAGTSIARVIGAGSALVLDPGEYMVWARITASAEEPVMPCGRLRVGDAR
jgi:hypothetical protein